MVAAFTRGFRKISITKRSFKLMNMLTVFLCYYTKSNMILIKIVMNVCILDVTEQIHVSLIH